MEYCHDCGCKEGEIHEVGCDCERCTNCGGQLISCDCGWDDVKNKHRIPYLQIPIICALCGKLWPDLFMDKDWEKYIIPEIQEEVLCKKCYNRMKRLFPNGWKNEKEKKIRKL